MNNSKLVRAIRDLGGYWIDFIDLLRQNFAHPHSYTKFKIIDKAEDFHNSIAQRYSDHLVFVDYLDVNNEAEYFKIKPYLKRIKRATKRVAVVALQKPPGRDDAYGGANIRADTDLYLAMDFGKITVVKAKDWQGENPNGKKYHFDIEHSGSMFTNIRGIYEGE